MPYVSVPRDITKIKSKVALGLTKRQLFCIGSVIAIGVPIYWFGRKVLGDDIAFYLMFFLICPIALAAVYEKDGIPFEKYILILIKARYLRPRTRIYQTNNLWEQLNSQIKIDKEVKRYVYLNKIKIRKKENNFKNRPQKGINKGAEKEDSKSRQKGEKDRENSKINTTNDPLPTNV